MVIMWGGRIRENEFLIFWLVCMEVAISFCVTKPTSSDARLCRDMLFVLLEAVSKAFTSILQFFWLPCWVPRDFHQFSFKGFKGPFFFFNFIK